jgi:hypothetical protein
MERAAGKTSVAASPTSEPVAGQNAASANGSVSGVRPAPVEHDPVAADLALTFAGTSSGNIVVHAATAPVFSDDLANGNLFMDLGVVPARTTGTDNVAVGESALAADMSGASNTAVGLHALSGNTASQNTAVGDSALSSNTTGTSNTAVGFDALLSNQGGFLETAIGYEALKMSQSGKDDVALGYMALRGTLSVSSTGNNNTACGSQALLMNQTGTQNVAIGVAALQYNTTGSFNYAAGVQALQNATVGGSNTAEGYQALFQYNDPTQAHGSTAVGAGAGSNLVSGDANVYIGNAGTMSENGAVRIGTTQTAAFIAGISGTPVTGKEVVITSGGVLGVTTSSRRFKQNIQDMGEESRALMRLRPVSFRYRPEYDPDGLQQYGLVAEEVEQVAPQLVVYDKDGAVQSVRYSLVNAMMLNELQRLRRDLASQEADLARLDTQRASDAEAVAQLESRVTTLETALPR